MMLSSKINLTVLTTALVVAIAVLPSGALADDERAGELLGYKVRASRCAISFSPATAAWIDRMTDSIENATDMTLALNGEIAKAMKSEGVVTYCWSLRDELLEKGLTPG